MHVLVTGSSGLIGSEAVSFFDAKGFAVTGVDNNTRADLFGPAGDTTPTLHRLKATCDGFTHVNLDIRDRAGIEELFRRTPVDLVIHAAAQPSHDLAAKRVFDDFEINAVGTLNLLEACRRHRPEAVFITVSTNKVYGDGPNRVPMLELATRYEYADPRFARGIDETFPIDYCLHSLFGVSKASGDLLTQEYGRYFGLRTGVFRGGCLTGPAHAGVEMHGFLSYLVRTCLAAPGGAEYTVYGHKGKQVRDQIHSADVVEALWRFAQAPRPGEVYNLGGGRQNAASLIECVEMIFQRTGRRPVLRYEPRARIGDHVCYYSDTTKFSLHYPGWRVTRPLGAIIDEMIAAEGSRRRSAA